MIVRNLEELEAWKIAHEFTLAVYRASRTFPKEEIFGVRSQLRRSSVSVPANVAEGFGRRSAKDFRRHLRIANGSLEEARYLLRLSLDLEYLAREEHESLRELADRVGALLGGLERHLSCGLSES